MMTGTPLFCLLFFLIPLVFSSSSTTHSLSSFTDNTAPAKIKVEDGSKIYLNSRDRAVYLSKITLKSNGNSITLDKLLNNFDADGFMNGWPVNSDLTIATTNSANVTHQLKGELFVATPTMAQDPNFLVFPVRGNKAIDRSTKGVTTIVFLASFNQNNEELPHYAGFKHIRVDNIVQPKDTAMFIYKYLPNDYYVDHNNENTTKFNIFSNPLKHNKGQTTFFESIDPLQFSETMWFRAIGGFKLTASDSYVDTTTIQTGAITVTGMSNSQLMTPDSQVTFMFQGSGRSGGSGYVLSSDLFESKNLTVQMNGPVPLTDSYTVFGVQNVNNMLREQTWQAVQLQLKPTGTFAGLYYVQYFNLDNGPATNAPTQATAAPTAAQTTSTMPVMTSTMAGGSSSAPSSSQTPPAAPSSSTTVQTTTSSSATCVVLTTFIVTILKLV